MDYDCVETAEEAVFLLHTEHFDCQCEICVAYRKTLLSDEQRKLDE